MLKIEAVATTWYTYELSEDEEKEVRKIIEENKNGEFDYGTDEENIIKAFEILHESKGTNLYQDDNTVESDFCTNEYKYSEFNECGASEWILGKEA